MNEFVYVGMLGAVISGFLACGSAYNYAHCKKEEFLAVASLFFLFLGTAFIEKYLIRLALIGIPILVVSVFVLYKVVKNNRKYQKTNSRYYEIGAKNYKKWAKTYFITVGVILVLFSLIDLSRNLSVLSIFCALAGISMVLYALYMISESNDKDKGVVVFFWLVASAVAFIPAWLYAGKNLFITIAFMAVTAIIIWLVMLDRRIKRRKHTIDGYSRRKVKKRRTYSRIVGGLLCLLLFIAMFSI